MVGSMATVPLGVAAVLRRGDYFIPAGGRAPSAPSATPVRSASWRASIRDGALPEPEVIVVPLGSGGTVAGILAGVLRQGLRSRVVGVSVAVAAPLGRAVSLALARAATRLGGGGAGLLRLARTLEIHGRHLGAGYGHPTAEGNAATRAAEAVGLRLDPTYTAKTFARALEEVRLPGRPGPGPVLDRHTLSAAPLGPLLENAPPAVPTPLESLLPRP